MFCQKPRLILQPQFVSDKTLSSSFGEVKNCEVLRAFEFSKYNVHITTLILYSVVRAWWTHTIPTQGAILHSMLIGHVRLGTSLHAATRVQQSIYSKQPETWKNIRKWLMSEHANRTNPSCAHQSCHSGGAGNVSDSNERRAYPAHINNRKTLLLISAQDRLSKEA